MKLLKRNLWLLYIIFAVLSLAVFSFLLHQSATNSEKNSIKQQHLAALVAKTTHSVLTNLEMTLDILGQDLIEDDAYLHTTKPKKILNKLLTINPHIAGFGLAAPNGTLTFISGNMDISKLPNLKNNSFTSASFHHALNSTKMVLGRTYFMTAANEWLLPIRKAIRDDNGNIIAVMTAGLKLGYTGDFLETICI